MLKNRLSIWLIVLLLTSQFVFSADRGYVLCEGNYMTNNASLWTQNENVVSQVSFPGGILGDTGQSMTIEDDKLYVICNNSNNIEVLDLSPDGESFSRTILLTNASPRYIVFDETAAYISCWLIPGILVLDKEEDTILDTIYTAGKPEDMLIVDDKLYVSIIEEKESYDKSDIIQEIDLSAEPHIIRNFTVAPGPEHMVYKDSILYSGSTYYDENWNAQIALSRIDLRNGNVLINDLEQTTGYSGSDLVLLDDTLYYAIQNGIYAIDPQTLQPDSGAIIQVDEDYFIYSLSIHNGMMWLGLTDDYIAPDYVYQYSQRGTFIDQFSVGASPGSFVFYSDNNTVDIITEKLPQTIELGSPYPNPFNAQVSIPYYITGVSRTDITIYALNGEIVSKKGIYGQSSGWQEYSWDASDVASGVYIISVSNRGTVITKKIVLLK